tara:strand:+ start:1314 stop:1559 length:246 start_codon:yes stop_codon:yes gene_type:complete
MKYAHVTVYPKRIEWRCREHGLAPDEGDTITGSEPINIFGCKDDTCQSTCDDFELLAWGRVMLSLTGHGVDEMEIRYEKED